MERILWGVYDNELAQELCPECILNKVTTSRTKYLRAMQSADIGIGTMGLHGSIGWKTAEYVAAARAIVTERMQYEIPGNFLEGKNYLSFTNAEECLRAVAYLDEHRDVLFEIKKANEKYFAEWSSPDRQVFMFYKQLRAFVDN